jgi:hypothetical protein
MKITDLKCAVIGGYPIVRITTDEGILTVSAKPNHTNHSLHPMYCFIVT